MKLNLHRAFTRPNLLTSSTEVAAILRGQLQPARYQHTHAESSLPRIISPSIWESIFPRSLRERTKEALKPSKDRKINPASYFIWIYILIGSQAIRILGVQNEANTYIRKADLKIGRLRDVVERLQRGESVDVEKALGTGNDEQETEWEEALREIEREERVWQDNRRTREQERKRLESEKQDADPVNERENRIEKASDLPATLPRPIPSAPSTPGFY